MAYIIRAYEPRPINLAPASIEEEIIQNIAMLIETPQFTVPLDRGFGLAQRFLDKPIQVAETILVSEVMDAIEQYEPRVEIVSIHCELGDTPGKLIPTVEVNIVGGSYEELPGYQFR